MGGRGAEAAVSGDRPLEAERATVEDIGVEDGIVRRADIAGEGGGGIR